MQRTSMEKAVSANDAVALLTSQVKDLVEQKPFLKEILNAFMGLMIAGIELKAELMALPGRASRPLIPRDSWQASRCCTIWDWR